MAEGHFQMQWPREGYYVEGFIHELLNYRYHWHQDQYELNILLSGSQEYCRGKQTYKFYEDDLALTSQGVGHSSFGQEANTRALCIRFSSLAFKPYLKKGNSFNFDSCISCLEDKDSPKYRRIRRYAAQLYLAGMSSSPYAGLMAKGSFELLLHTLCEDFHPEVLEINEMDEEQQELTARLTSYLEEHAREKITLQDLADFSQYNRTYISTLFKNNTGVNFHEYLTRVRFQNALLDLAVTDKNLTEIALENGFSDLKSFNRVFREILHRSPAEYREQLIPALISPSRSMSEVTRRYVSPEDELVQQKLQEYIR